MSSRRSLPPLGSPQLRRLDAKLNGAFALGIGLLTVATRGGTDIPAVAFSVGLLLVGVGVGLVLAPEAASARLLTVTSAGISLALAIGLSGEVRGGNISAGAVMYVLIVLDVSLLRSRREAWFQLGWAMVLYGVMLSLAADTPQTAGGTTVVTALVLATLSGAITVGRRWLDELLGELHRQADHDPLTGLLHRDGLQRRIRDVLATQPNAASTSIAGVLALDIDHFKAINDGHGHPAGDEVLVWLSGVLQSTVPPPGLVARVGGEEFIVILPDATLAETFDRAERLRQLIASASALQLHPVTVSIGVSNGQLAGDTDGRTMTAYYRAADEALYRAKNAGRNRVEVGLPVIPDPKVVPQRRAADVPVETTATGGLEG